MLFQKENPGTRIAHDHSLELAEILPGHNSCYELNEVPLQSLVNRELFLHRIRQSRQLFPNSLSIESLFPQGGSVNTRRTWRSFDNNEFRQKSPNPIHECDS